MRRFPYLTEKLLAEARHDEVRTGRRDVLRVLGRAGLLSCIPILGCGGDDTLTDTGLADSGADTGSTTDSATDADAATTEGWASGGTAAMVDKPSYPDPFSADPGTCALVSTTTRGPCTTATELVREDISEGEAGLPVRLALKLVDRFCAPLAGLSVNVWHTNVEGSYSGETPANDFCLLDPGYSASDFFRGAQMADADGAVYFDTCFPGWYRGRAIHIHFQVRSGEATARVSQLFFPEDVTAGIFATHDDYAPYGQPDTTFATDSVVRDIPSAELPRHVLDVQRMSDGAMLASRIVTVV